MNTDRPMNSASGPQLPITDARSVPIFDCHVILRKDEANGTIHARVSSLAGITAEGSSERDVLLKVVDRFKKALQDYRVRGEAIPWMENPEKPAPGEQQRWIPVHL